MSKENQKLLQELYHTTNMGIEASQMVLQKVKNQGMKRALRAQQNSYRKIAEQSARMLAEDDQSPRPESLMQKMALWGSVQMNTIRDSTTPHLAEMLIQGSNMGIINVTRELNRLPDSDAGARQLAEEYLQSDQAHIETMKQYL